MTAILDFPMISQDEAILFLRTEVSRRQDTELGATLSQILWCLQVGDEVSASAAAFRATEIVSGTLSDRERGAFSSALVHFQLYA